jgi:nicotinic acid mononucleotide adenylyltransferase
MMDSPEMTSRNASAKKRVCLFGLSADPPTGQQGHVGIVQALVDLDEEEWDEIWVLPVYRHTFSVRRTIFCGMCTKSFARSSHVLFVSATKQYRKSASDWFPLNIA